MNSILILFCLFNFQIYLSDANYRKDGLIFPILETELKSCKTNEINYTFPINIKTYFAKYNNKLDNYFFHQYNVISEWELYYGHYAGFNF